MGVKKKTTRKESPETEEDEKGLMSPEAVWDEEGWAKFEKFYPFAKYTETKAGVYEIVVNNFIDDYPSTYLNKWGGTRYRVLCMLVSDKQVQHWLTGGKRLFTALKEFCIAEGIPKLSVMQHPIRITRYGKNVDARYEVDYP